jgi:hypothetical protein
MTAPEGTEGIEGKAASYKSKSRVIWTNILYACKGHASF